MTKHLLIMCAMFGVSLLPIFGDEMDSCSTYHEGIIGEIQHVYENKLNDIGKQYLSSLERLLADFKKTGDFVTSKTVTSEIERFEIAKTSPDKLAQLPKVKSLQKSYNKQRSDLEFRTATSLLAVIKRYDAALVLIQKNLVTSNRLDLAEDVEVRRKVIRNGSTAEWARDHLWRDITKDLLGGIRNEEDDVVLKSAVYPSLAYVQGILNQGGVAKSSSKEMYSAPLEIEYVCKTDSTDVRISYGCDQVIFNWAVDPSQLRIDGGPANGRHVAGAGRIPTNTFVRIRQVVEADKMAIYVDETRRATWNADFSKTKSKISIFSGKSVVTVQSIRVKEMKESEI